MYCELNEIKKKKKKGAIELSREGPTVLNICFLNLSKISLGIRTCMGVW